MERVLFLCTHNSARSQMAEGMLRAWGRGRYEAFSAGVEATEVRPLAIRAMAEIGIDVAGQRSKAVGIFRGQWFDRVITVCDDAREACPYFPGTDRQTHWSFADPASVEGSEAERLDAYRRVRDEIAERIQSDLLR